MFGKFYLLILFTLLAVGGCGERIAAPQESTPVHRYSKPQVCDFATSLAQFDVNQPDSKQLRFLNERWRTLQQDEVLRPDETKHGQQLMTALNYHLARDSITKIHEVLEHTVHAYEQIEGLRRFSSNPKEMKVPDSMIRNLRNAVQDCCADALSSNATALLRADNSSGLYAVGRLAYFIERDVNRLLDNELSFARYRNQLQTAAAKLSEAPVAIDLNANWVTCR
ncbi:hypothetical protein ACQ5ES_07215 [Pseudidiomarina sp. E22-M8]|uniref:hypothetical protein n=1 Tax=Pseudidiomarina sp. E22-M8 TaxID=3424768 RepID=UPI00403C11DD